jgi:hypothetical protein
LIVTLAATTALARIALRLLAEMESMERERPEPPKTHLEVAKS